MIGPHRKDKLWAGIVRMQEKHPRWKESSYKSQICFFSFGEIMPHTLLLPEDKWRLKNEIAKARHCLWIMKPPNSNCGQGIRVVQSRDLVHASQTEEECIVS